MSEASPAYGDIWGRKRGCRERVKKTFYAALIMGGDEAANLLTRDDLAWLV